MFSYSHLFRSLALANAVFGAFLAVASPAAAASTPVTECDRLAADPDGRIKAVLAEVRTREGALSLERLRDLPDDEVVDYLTSLPGIGTKTAACVLAFSLQRPALPVDTHVARIAQRLGLVEPKASADAIQALLEGLLPPRSRLDAHLDLIAHGRATCTARRPACSACVVADVCPSATSFST